MLNLARQTGIELRQLHHHLKQITNLDTEKILSSKVSLLSHEDIQLIQDLKQEGKLESSHIQVVDLKSLASNRSLSRNRSQLIHGDLHLGQILKCHDEIVFIDFDTEPIRGNPKTVRGVGFIEDDLASMIRSWEYLVDHIDLITNPPKNLLKKQLTHAFVSGYASGQPNLHIHMDYLNFACFAKALREYKYEKQYRPEWIEIPLKGVNHYWSTLNRGV